MKSPFSIFCTLSIILHTIVICSFFRYMAAEEDPPDREIMTDTADWDHLTQKELAELALGQFADSLAFDSLWEADSTFLLDLLEQTETSDFPWDENMEADWFGTPGDHAATIDRLLERYRTTKGADTLFALNEMMRRHLLQRFLDLARQSPGALPDSLSKWKKYLDRIAQELSRLPETGADRTTAALRKRLLNSFAADSEMVKLWKEAMLCSLRKVARDSLNAAARKTARQCLLECLGNRGSPDGLFPSLSDKSSEGTSNFPSKHNSSGSSYSPYPGDGGTGPVTGTAPVPAGQYEDLFTLIMTGMIQSNGMGPMLSLLPFDDLVESLAKEAKNALNSALRGDSAGLAWAQSIDFKKALSRALSQAMQCNSRVADAKDDFLGTIKKALGDDIFDWLQGGPTSAQLRGNPGYFDGWARDYLSFLSNMTSHPNMVLPDLDKFAEAARKMRNRYLPESEQIILGGGSLAPADSIDYLIPEKIFLPPQPSQLPQSAGPRALKKPDAQCHAYGGAQRRTVPIRLDGDLSEWQSCIPFALCGSPSGLTSLPPYLKGSNCIMVQWDNRGLYFAYVIHDKRDNPHYVPAFWDTDAFEIFLDPHNRKDIYRVEGRSYQFWIWPRATGERGSTGISMFSDPLNFTPRPLKEGAIRFASVRKGERYTCEAFVPASLIDKWIPLPGKIIGFNFSVNNGENIYLRWITNMGANISEHPNLWGDLILMGSDGQVRLEPEKFLLPGATLTVTVIDHDMNLSAGAPDKVWVKASSLLTGDKIPFNLVETGNDSGIFTGVIGTVFAFKPKVKNRLSTRPGDRIEIFYLDQQRPGGEKDAPVTCEIAVVRGVMALRGK